MITTTQINKENVLLRLDGTYNDVIHKKLNNIIHNISVNKVRTNPTLSLDDLKQESWLRIYEVIDKNLKKGIELEISYLITIAQTTTLGICQKETKRLENIDYFASNLISVSDGAMEDNNSVKTNVAKAKLEYELSMTRSDEEKSTVLRISLEDLLESMEDEVVRNLILIRYIKECNGTSERIIKLYDNFKATLDSERLKVLNDMDKFTSNSAFKVLGMRATDNRSTQMRKDMKDILSQLLDK
jgi:DNA-directed RNA polymerase specialized sigma24 family protein